MFQRDQPTSCWLSWNEPVAICYCRRIRFSEIIRLDAQKHKTIGPLQGDPPIHAYVFVFSFKSRENPRRQRGGFRWLIFVLVIGYRFILLKYKKIIYFISYLFLYFRQTHIYTNMHIDVHICVYIHIYPYNIFFPHYWPHFTFDSSQECQILYSIFFHLSIYKPGQRDKVDI